MEATKHTKRHAVRIFMGSPAWYLWQCERVVTDRMTVVNEEQNGVITLSPNNSLSFISFMKMASFHFIESANFAIITVPYR